MSDNTTETPHGDTLRSQMSQENGITYKAPSGEILSHEHYNDTPLTIVGTEETGYFVAFGKYRLTPTQATKEQAKQLLEYANWNIICNLLALFTDFAKLDFLNAIQRADPKPQDHTEINK